MKLFKYVFALALVMTSAQVQAESLHSLNSRIRRLQSEQAKLASLEAFIKAQFEVGETNLSKVQTKRTLLGSFIVSLRKTAPEEAVEQIVEHELSGQAMKALLETIINRNQNISNEIKALENSIKD